MGLNAVFCHEFQFCISFLLYCANGPEPHPARFFLSLVFQERILGIIRFYVVKWVIYKKIGRALAAIAHCQKTP